MGTFGENLKREREMRGVTLEEISNATKIGVRALQALEAEEFSKLPGGIFTRSFLRSYARYLGLDEDSVMAEYQIIAPRDPNTDLRRIGQQWPLRAEKSSRAPLVGLVAAASLLAGGFALYRYSHRPSLPANASTSAAGSNPAQSVTQTPNIPEAQAAPQSIAQATQVQAGNNQAPINRASGLTEATPGASETQAASEGIAQTTPTASAENRAPITAAPGDLVLQVAATERAWVAVDADSMPAFQRILNPNEIQTLHAKNSFDVITGNARGIILTLNGVTLEPLGHRGEVRKVHLTLDDLKNSHP